MPEAGFARGNVTVDNDFARFGSKSYAINKINSVEVRAERDNSDAGWVICGLITAICLVSMLHGFSAGTLLVAAVTGALTYFFWQSSQVLTYKLFLMTSSSEVQALQSVNKSEIDDLRSAIESAMVAQK